MRKAISLLLVTLLVLTSGIAAFAADVTVPSDVKGTRYETAVTDLMNKIGLTGYTDGTFRPDNAINRAEVCTILVKALQPSASDLKAAPVVFNDMSGADIKWAQEYVNYGAFKGLVKGYDGGLFRPVNNVTYNEMATMLVNALGYTDKDLTGAWPESHVSKATELGVFKDVAITGKGNSDATRGDVALMTAVVADKIIEQGKKPSGEPSTSGGAITPSTSGGAIAPPTSSGAVTTPSGIDGEDPATKDGGGAFGVIDHVFKMSGKNGSTVQGIDFLMSDGIKRELKTNKGDMVSDSKYDGTLYYVKFDGNGDVSAVFDNPAKADVKHYEALAGKNGWTDVKDMKNRLITLANGTEIAISRDAVFYNVEFFSGAKDGYETASLHDIQDGTKIRAYDITDDGTAAADVVVIVLKDDVEKHGAEL